MEIKNRLFPYPVLCSDNDDYEGSFFKAKCDLKEELSDIILDFQLSLESNEELEWLIRDGYAEYVVHMECSYTGFRTIIKKSGNQFTYRIPKSKVNVEIEIVCAIVASEKIVSFESKHLNEDYADEDISFARGAILAYYNLPKIYVTKNYEELASDNAFFTIIKRVKTDNQEINPVIYDINSAKIKIMVDEEIYDEYAKYHINPNMEALMSSLLVMPAIMYMVETVREEGIGNLDKYKPLYWYQKISKACKLQGQDFYRDYLDTNMTCIEIAQQLLQNPINRAFDGLAKVIEE